MLQSQDGKEEIASDEAVEAADSLSGEAGQESDPLAIARVFPRSIPKVVGWMILVFYLVLGFAVDYYIVGIYFTPMNFLWRLLFVVSLINLGALFNIKKPISRPMAEGRVAVVIPVYNEDEETLRLCLQSLLEQSRLPDEIHVIDDGSPTPVVPFDHPLIHWHRQQNKGKREAQALAFRAIDYETIDFILTVDSDTLLNTYALEYALRGINDPEVYAVTGTIYTPNYRKNLLTRVVDLNVGVGIMMVQPQRNLVGAQETTCGPLSLYRAEVVYDNIDNYLNSGTYGDDRRLNIYALLYGKTLGIREAVAYSDVPETMGALIRQRLRWAKSPWLQLPFMLTNLKFSQVIFPLMSVAQWLLLLFLVFFFTSYTIVFQNIVPVAMFLILMVVIRAIQVILFLFTRADMGFVEKVLTLIFLTPLEVILRLFLLLPIKTAALFMLGDKSWGTRGLTEEAPQSENQ